MLRISKMLLILLFAMIAISSSVPDQSTPCGQLICNADSDDCVNCLRRSQRATQNGRRRNVKIRNPLEISRQFIGKWKLVESINFDEYMKAIGIGYLARLVGNLAKPTMTIEVHGDHIKVVSESTFKTFTLEFDIGKEFTETTIDGRQMSSIFTLSSDGKLIQEQRKIKAEDKDSTITRYVVGRQLITICESQGIVAKRIYEKVDD